MSDFSFAFDEGQLVKVRSALNVLIASYNLMAEKEESPVSKQDLLAYVKNGEALLTRFRAARGDVAEVLTKGEVSVLERGLQMSANKWARSMRLEMTPTEKAAIREEAEKASGLITLMRRARGLPW